ncbi:MFS transporter (plasmid) [Rhodococcus aetherivorans]
MVAVLALALLPLLGPASPVAAAGGFDCKDVPQPEFPNSAFPSLLDSTSAAQEPTEGGTGYQTYGWAGLKWHTYDLGCGEDLVRAPDAVSDTALGNTFLTLGKSLAAAAFWLDDQTQTTAEGDRPSAMQKFDEIVVSISRGMSEVYALWIGIGLTVVAAIILWKALKADSAGVTRTAALAAAALTLGALMVGAPQKAIEVADETFGSLITDTQDQIFSVSFGGGGGSGTLASGPTDPRNVLLDRVFLEDWRKGWFGSNYDDDVNRLGPDLRDALAFSYAQQRQVSGNANAQNALAEEKADKFRQVVDSLGGDNATGVNLPYSTFQGKDSGRTGIGLMAMVKLGLPSILWIGASILKITALLAIRFAILFAPIWVPLAVAHGGTLARVMRMLASAYMWAVAGAVIVALYLMALVQLYITDNHRMDGSWRLWFMILLTAICWFIMRPFKRLSQTFTANHASVFNRKTRSAQQSLKHKLFTGASAVVGGPAGTIAEEAVGALRKATRGHAAERDLEKDSVTPIRPEGRDLNHRRQVDATRARADAHKQALSRKERLAASGVSVQNRNDRHAGIAAAADSAAVRDKPNDPETEPATNHGLTPHRQAGQTRVDRIEIDRTARGQSAPTGAGIGQRWDGGEQAAIAPMKVYTPRRGRSSPDGVIPMVAIPAPRRAQDLPPTSVRLWDASLPRSDRPAPGHDSDRYG